MLPVRFFIDCDEMDAGYRHSDHEDGASLEVFTVQADPMVAADNTLRAIVKALKKSNACTGILFNPQGEYELFVPRELVLNAIGAGYRIAMDEIEAEAELFASANSPHDVIWERAVEEDDFAEVANRIRAFEDDPDDFLKISFLDDDDALFAQVFRTETEGERQLCFGFSMDDFGWEKPLVLGKALPTEDVISLLKRVCVDGESPDDMEEIMSFKSMG
jgi:hypothetical protein